jgi:hypothetical protein
MWIWRHIFGNIAGMLIYSTLSGLMTMSPRGLLESKDAVSRGDLQAPMSWADVRLIGKVREFADGTTKAYRWFLGAMHNIDLPFMRIRPGWDIIVAILLAGVTISCAIGAWLSVTRVGQDISRLSRLFRRKETPTCKPSGQDLTRLPA